MKRISLFVLSFFIMSSVVSAQPRYRGFVEAGYGALVGDKSGSEVTLNTSHGLIFNHIFVGVGIGANYTSVTNPDYDPAYVRPGELADAALYTEVKTFTGVTVPLFINIKGLWEQKKLSPVLELKAGVGKGFTTGLFGEGGAGCRISTGKKYALLITGFFKYANEPQNITTDDSKYSEGKFSTVGLKLAYEF